MVMKDSKIVPLDEKREEINQKRATHEFMKVQEQIIKNHKGKLSNNVFKESPYFDDW